MHPAAAPEAMRIAGIQEKVQKDQESAAVMEIAVKVAMETAAVDTETVVRAAMETIVQVATETADRAAMEITAAADMVTAGQADMVTTVQVATETADKAATEIAAAADMATAVREVINMESTDLTETGATAATATAARAAMASAGLMETEVRVRSQTAGHTAAGRRASSQAAEMLREPDVLLHIMRRHSQKKPKSASTRCSKAVR